MFNAMTNHNKQSPKTQIKVRQQLFEWIRMNICDVIDTDPYD